MFKQQDLTTMIFTSIAIAFLFFLFTYTLKHHTHFIIPINWPLVGMLPYIFLNLHRLYDYGLDVLEKIDGETFLFKGPWLTSMEYLFTVDPANVHYVMSKNFKNFPKGAKFSEIHEIFGDGIFNVDFELWEYQRKNLHSFFTNSRFNKLLVETIGRKVELGLIPILKNAYEKSHVVDLENLFQRFTFDTICTLVTGHDPGCLSIDLPDAPFCKALDDVEEVLFYRQAVPESVWKLQRWLGVGKERKLIKAREILDNFLYEVSAKKMIEMNKTTDNNALNWMSLWLLEENYVNDDKKRSKFLRDMFLNMLIAGRDTTSVALTWFFWLVSKNGHIENRLREEVRSLKDINRLVYLHGALYETLRLYPSVPFQRKTPVEIDVLPSGHKVDPKTTIVIPVYIMGRNKSIWGDDCLEFKPERWITERGRVKHEPSYNFFAFNAGPRTCLGKEVAFVQMKAIASSIFLHDYKFQIIEEHKVEPALSIILHTKKGLKVKVIKSTSSC